MKTLIRLIALALLYSGTTGCARVAAEEPETIRIGVCLALSSTNREVAKRTLAGVKMRQEEWNNSGATPLIELVIRDDEGELEQSKKHVRDLVENEGVVALIGPGLSNPLREVREYLREKRVVAISPNATHPDIGVGDDWIFRLHADDISQAEALARHAYTELNLRRAAAIINTNYPYPEVVYRPFKESFVKLGGEIVSEERFSWKYNVDNVFDFSEILDSMAEHDPDLIFLPLFPTEVAEIMNESLDIRLNSKLNNVVFCGTDTWESRLLLEAGGNMLLRAHYVSGLNLAAKHQAMLHFLTQYNISNVPDIEPGSIFGYDTLSLILYCLKDGISSESLRNNLYSLRNHSLASGPISITHEHGTLRPVYIHRIVEDDNFFKSRYLRTEWPEGMDADASSDKE